MTIVVHIDRLVLDGLDLAPGMTARLGAAVEAELTQLLTRGELPMGIRTGGAVPSLPGGTISVAPRQPTAPLGRSIARAVHGGLAR
ncbi:MAG TPA: hypothetical protein VFP58_12150 [Candidatus Eisenbacteria bacterium]|nr:hypothetical protein [Candidatus Eisenbacteria bacterium]